MLRWSIGLAVNGQSVKSESRPAKRAQRCDFTGTISRRQSTAVLLGCEQGHEFVVDHFGIEVVANQVLVFVAISEYCFEPGQSVGKLTIYKWGVVGVSCRQALVDFTGKANIVGCSRPQQG